MERKEFLKKLGLGLLTIPLVGCKDEENPINDACPVTDSTTAGPFPTHDPDSLEIADIKSDREGVPLTVQITLLDESNGCTPLTGALVDIWHCDKDGNYSEYNNQANAHFLRGRQTTNGSGIATFASIYPGWYPGRAPHIHVHVYDSDGNSLLVSQIAFPEEINTTVYTSSPVYSSRGEHDTTNSEDGIFRGKLDTMLGEVSGMLQNNSYPLHHTIIVS